MRGLTIRQPWASLIAAGVKTVETRSWSTSYRGPLLIHAGKHRPRSFWLNNWIDGPRYYEQVPEPFRSAGIDLDHWFDPQEGMDGDGQWLYDYRWSNFPLGAVVAVADLVDVAPMTEGYPTADDVKICLRPDDSPCGWSTWARPWLATLRADRWGKRLDQEVPLGQYEVGRYAWLLDNVRPLSTPIPAKGRQGLWTPDADLIQHVAAVTEGDE